MHTKRFALVLAFLLIITILTGCYDLGEGVEDEAEYCKVFEDIILFDSNGDQVTDYEMEDFYNKEAVNSFASPIPYENCDKFTYMAIGFAKDLSLGEIAIYFNSKDTGKLSVSAFLLDSDDLPTSIITESNGLDPDKSDEPSNDKIIAQDTVSLMAGEKNWSSIMIKNWKLDSGKISKKVNVESGKYLVLRFDNNCYSYEKREYEKLKGIFEKVEADYLSAKNIYDEKYAEYNSGGEDVTIEDLKELKDNLDKLTLEYNKQKPLYENAKIEYEKSENLEPLSIRMTAILIRTNKEA